MDWINAIKSFIAVIDAHSFTKAAENRFTSPAGISRQIRWLEQQLNVTLITRSTRTLQLTAEGKFFYQKAEQLLADLTEITQSLQNQNRLLSGPLKITLPISFGTIDTINQLIFSFSQQHPKIEMQLDFSNRTYDLITEEIDIAFRATPFTGNHYSSVKILDMQIGLFAAPAYLAAKGNPKTLEELASHNCLGHQYIGRMEWEMKNNKKIWVAGNVKANASHPLIELAKLGQGIIRTLENYVKKEVEDNKLQPILKKEWPAPIGIYMVIRADATIPLRVKAFRDFANKWFGKEEA